MEPIDSPQNQHIRLYRNLAEPAGRREHGLMQVEGVRLVEEALAASAPLQWVAICPSRLTSDRALALVERLRRQRVPLLTLTERAFDAMGDTVSPAGIAATCKIVRSSLDALPLAEHDLLLAIHEARDPGNMGSMIRTAAAFGCSAVVALDDCVDPYSPKTIRASAGSIFRLPLVATTWSRFVRWAGEQGVAIVATAARGGVVCGSVPIPLPAALVIGSEAHGLPEAALSDAQLVLSIPMRGETESLNAAVAAGVLLYAVTAGAAGGH